MEEFNVEYVRKDLYESLQKENEKLKKENEKLTEGWVQMGRVLNHGK